jgi:hypothetical protein
MFVLQVDISVDGGDEKRLPVSRQPLMVWIEGTEDQFSNVATSRPAIDATALRTLISAL